MDVAAPVLSFCLFVQLKPSTDWTMPTCVGEQALLHSLLRTRMLISSETPSQARLDTEHRPSLWATQFSQKDFKFKHGKYVLDFEKYSKNNLWKYQKAYNFKLLDEETYTLR